MEIVVGVEFMDEGVRTSPVGKWISLNPKGGEWIPLQLIERPKNP